MLIALGVVIAVVAVAAFITTDNLLQFGATPAGDRLERISRSPQWDGTRFHNPVKVNMSFGVRGFGRMMSRWMFGSEVREPKREVPFVALDGKLYRTPPETGLRITWLGHSTVLIEIDGHRFLTDPVWAERASPSSIVGPRRFHPPPLALADLPPLDAVLISHDHFDHLDKESVLPLADTGVVFLMPLGVGAHLEKWGVPGGQIVELDWWDLWHAPGTDLQIAAAPARHFSGRAPGGTNATLWASWAVIGPKHRVFFSGDTGPYAAFEEIGDAYGPFDVTFLDCGAYDRLWADVHLNPINAVKAHVALKGNLLIPIHWGTFKLAFHDWTEPAELLARTAGESGVSFAIPQPGQPVIPSAPPALERWWAARD